MRRHSTRDRLRDVGAIMATMKPAASWEDLRDRIESFLLGLRRPILTEPGREVLDLSSCSYSLSTQHNKLLWHVWNHQTNLVRQITEIRKETPGRMELRFQKFGKGPPGTLVLSETRAAPEQTARRSQRTRYAQMLRRLLGQLFPEWKVEELSVEPDHKHSISGRYARAMLRRGQQTWAVVGSGEHEDVSAADEILTHGLIWLDWLRRSQPDRVISGLKVFLPAGRADTTLHRIAWLDCEAARWEVYETGEETRRRDPADAGNLKTSLGPAELVHRSSIASEWDQRMGAVWPNMQRQSAGDGFAHWTVHGVPVARETANGLVFGIGRSETPLTEETFSAFEQLVHKLLHWRRSDSPDRHHPFYRLWPERWMQSQVVQQMDKLGYDLLPGAVYQQVPAVSGAERGVLDLLAIDSRGRLAVVELKASESIHLPLQALDYWMRVHWHHRRGEFERGRYFPEQQLNPSPPLLLLVSPVLQMHPACETVLRYFSPKIEVAQIGLNEDWRAHWQVVYRSRRKP